MCPRTLKLDHFKYAMIVDDEITLFGVKPPSSQSIPIPKQELSVLYPVSGLSQLNQTIPYTQIVYTDVRIRKRDFRRIIRSYVYRARNLEEQIRSMPRRRT